MKCANCGRELIFGTYDNEPAYTPCVCYDVNCDDCDHCDNCNRVDPDDYCDDCGRLREEHDTGYDEGVASIHVADIEEAAFDRGESSGYEHGYDEGFAAATRAHPGPCTG